MHLLLYVIRRKRELLTSGSTIEAYIFLLVNSGGKTYSASLPTTANVSGNALARSADALFGDNSSGCGYWSIVTGGPTTPIGGPTDMGVNRRQTILALSYGGASYDDKRSWRTIEDVYEQSQTSVTNEEQ